MSFVADPTAKTAPIRDAPVMSPRLRERLSMPEMAPRWFVLTSAHDRSVVGCLKEGITGSDDNDGSDVARDAERRRQYG